MKKTLAIILCLTMVLLVCSACGDKAPAGTDGEKSANGDVLNPNAVTVGGMLPEVASDGKLMVDGVVYVESNVVISEYVGEMDQMDTITSSVDLTEIPTEDGQSNFECIGAPYTPYENGLVVFLDDTWIYFMPME